jgi:carnitine O-acetyltransferase
MYDRQSELPYLPLPVLENSCNKLLEWSHPLLNDEEYSSSEMIIELFKSEKGLGPVLQKYLEEWNQREDIPNWLEPFWYDTYLKNRLPLPINSNVAFVLEKNKQVDFLSKSEFVASLIISLFQYNQILLNENLEIDYQGASPLCMIQYKTILGTARIPGIEKDALHTDSDTQHIAIFIKGHYYILNVLAENHEILDYSTILNSISWIVENSKDDFENAIGSLTTLNRTEWAGYRNHLTKIDSTNTESIDLIETALAVIVLDQNTLFNDSEGFKSMLCGDSNNRWFDKSLQFIVNEDYFAVNYEHSGVDGTTLGNLVRYLYKNMQAYDNNGDKNAINQVKEISFTLDESLEAAISKAKESHEKAYDDLVIEVLSFTDFGKDHIKDLKISPDSFIQIGIQLAQHNAFGRVSNTYEAVMTKQFLKGRTEAMRPVTKESIQFIKSQSKEDLLDASKKHIERIIECKNGQGIDRHLYGLKKMHEINFPEQVLPEIFNSPSYQSVTENFISTSTSKSTGLIFAGYGPSINDGYAVRYLIYKDKINFVLSCKTQSESSLQKLKSALKQALNDMSLILNQ